jgi:hypothetical protein
VRISLIAVLIMLVLSPQIHSSPWIGTVEPQLQQDLQTLSEWGYIDAAITSFPVPWKGIADQIERLHESDVALPAVVALQRLKHYLSNLKKEKKQSFISLYAGSEKSRFTGFDEALPTQTTLNISTEFYAGRWAGNLSINYLPGGEKDLDNSFVAYQFGDWNLRFGSLDQWWGPSSSSSLILSNNARPIPAIALSRAQTNKTPDSWLRFLGPWYFTTQLGQLESSRDIADAKLLMSRFNFKPVSAVELGLSWLAMWGGKGQGNGLDDLWEVISLAADCPEVSQSCEDNEFGTKGNHLAALDLKYTTTLLDLPFSLYGQLLAETRSSQKANLIGLATYIQGYRVYFESSDTVKGCGNGGVDNGNCIYEDNVYTSGLRYHKRAIGSTFDRDAKMQSIGLSKHFANGDAVKLTILQAKLITDGNLPSPVGMGSAEKIRQLSAYYQTNWGDWQFKIGGQIASSEMPDRSTVSNNLVYTKIKYAIN